MAVYPGHEEPTTIEMEKRTNPFLTHKRMTNQRRNYYLWQKQNCMSCVTGKPCSTHCSVCKAGATPLTRTGEQGIHYLGLGLRDVDFVEAVSSDSGRAIETMRLILGEHVRRTRIPYHIDKRIREWCFGSLEGAYDAEMWGVLPRILDFPDYDDMIANHVSFEAIANAIYHADTANWAETFDVLTERVKTGFEDIAYRVEKKGGGNALVVSHGLTIAFLCI